MKYPWARYCILVADCIAHSILDEEQDFLSSNGVCKGVFLFAFVFLNNAPGKFRK